MVARTGAILPDGGFTTAPLAPVAPPTPKPAPTPPTPTPAAKPPDVEVIPVVPGGKTPTPAPGQVFVTAPVVGSTQPPIVIAAAPAVPATPTQVIAPPPIVGQPLPGATGSPAPTPTTPAPTAPTPTTDTLPPPDTSAGSDSDYASAQALADANQPDLTGLPPWELDDPFAARGLEAANPALKGGSALNAIAQACADFDMDTRACIAVAEQEGAGGGIGDGGTSYGPFQLHDGGALPDALSGKGKNNAKVNAWAWSENGLRYAVRQMAAARPSAKGLIGHAAVYAIVYGFERPSNERAEYNAAAKEYDHLTGLGAGWATYAADRLAGPKAGGATDTGIASKPPTAATSPAGKEKPPAGVQTGWASIIDFYSKGVPKHKGAVHSFADSLVNVFKGG